MATAFKYKIPTCTSSGRTAFMYVNAMNTDVPGIIITECTDDFGTYRLTHRKSGCGITQGKWSHTHDVFGLLALAQALGKVANWRQHGKNISTKATGEKVLALLKASEIEWFGTHDTPEQRMAAKRHLGLVGSMA